MFKENRPNNYNSTYRYAYAARLHDIVVIDDNKLYPVRTVRQRCVAPIYTAATLLNLHMATPARLKVEPTFNLIAEVNIGSYLMFCSSHQNVTIGPLCSSSLNNPGNDYTLYTG